MMLLNDDLVERVGRIIPRYSMLTAGNRVGVAVSGGADSVVLLHILHSLVSQFALHLIVLHVNHGLRGAESDEDERFVRDLAAELGLEFFASGASPRPGNLEQEARLIRREWFQLWRRDHGLDKIALGHTRSDQAETVLYRFLRGSGTAGLAGMRFVTEDGFIRPLMTTSRSEVRAWAASRSLQWREDSSNSDEGFVRNRLRNRVMPALASDFNPNLEGVLAGMADVAATEENYWHSLIEPLYEKSVRKTELGLFFPVSTLIGMHLAMQRRVVRRAIGEIRGSLRSIDLPHVEAVLAVCRSSHGHDRVVIPGVDAIRSFDTLLLTRPGAMNSGVRNYAFPISCGEKVQLPPGIGEVELRLIESNEENCVNFKEDSQLPFEIADFDFEALTTHTPLRLEIRNWRPGDEILRPGHQRAEKIKSLFQECQVLLWERRHWPVAVVNGELFWARGFGPAFPYMATRNSQKVLRLCFWPGSGVIAA